MINDGQTYVDNNEEGCKYQQFLIVMDIVNEMEKAEENIQDSEGGDSLTKIQEYMGEESLKDKLEETAHNSEEENNNDEEIEDK